MNRLPSTLRSLPAKETNTDQLVELSDRFITILLYFDIALFAITTIEWSISAFKTRNYLFLSITGFAFLWICLSTFIRRIPRSFRSATLRYSLYGLGLFSIITGSLGRGGISLLFLFCLTTVILRGLGSGILAIILSIISMGVSGWLIYENYIPPAQGTPFLWNDWVYSIGLFMVIMLPTEYVISRLIDEFRAYLTKSNLINLEVKNRTENEEGDITQRTQDLEKRLVQIRTAAEITKVINGVLDQPSLLSQVVNLIKDRFNLYYVGLFLLDETKQNAVLWAGTGEAGEKMLADKHHLPIGGNSMIGWSISFRKPRIALDVGEEAVRFKNPLLPLTQSEVALPLLVRDNVLGALSLQSSEENAFDENDVITLQTIADALAIAIENTSLFEQTRNSLNEIRALHGQYLTEAWKQMSTIKGDLSYTFEQTTQIKTDDNNHFNQVNFPLVLRDQSIGDIILDIDKKDLTPEELVLVESISTQTALALENARLFEETQRRTQQEMTLNSLSAKFSLAMDIDTILRTAVRELSNIQSVAEVTIQLGSPDQTNPATSSVDQGKQQLSQVK